MASHTNAQIKQNIILFFLSLSDAPNSSSLTSEAARSPSALSARSMFFERSMASLSRAVLTAQPILFKFRLVFRFSYWRFQANFCAYNWLIFTWVFWYFLIRHSAADRCVCASSVHTFLCCFSSSFLTHIDTLTHTLAYTHTRTLECMSDADSEAPQSFATFETTLAAKNLKLFKFSVMSGGNANYIFISLNRYCCSASVNHFLAATLRLSIWY